MTRNINVIWYTITPRVVRLKQFRGFYHSCCINRFCMDVHYDSSSYAQIILCYSCPHVLRVPFCNIICCTYVTICMYMSNGEYWRNSPGNVYRLFWNCFMLNVNITWHDYCPCTTINLFFSFSFLANSTVSFGLCSYFFLSLVFHTFSVLAYHLI